MEHIYDLLNWAWSRHHNPASWYIRPFFVLPFCYFAYKQNRWGCILTVAAAISSMFWFSAPASTDARSAEFLALEREYLTAWSPAKLGLVVLIPVWFMLIAWAFWRRSWLVGVLVINLGAVLKVAWSFVIAGESAWSIVPAVGLGLLGCNAAIVYAYRQSFRNVRKGTGH